MKHPRKPAEKTGKHSRKDFTYCPDCGKRRYNRRSTAKAAIRSLVDNKSMREYRCPILPGWHIGHLPAQVRRGERDDNAVWNRRATRDERSA